MARRENKQILDKQAREFVVRLRDYFEREQQNGGSLLPLIRVVERVSATLQIGTNTVCRITREKYSKSGMEDNDLKTPNKPRIRRKRIPDKSSKSTAGGKKVAKECNPRVNGVSTKETKSKINTTESNINTYLKTVSNMKSLRGKLQKTCVTKAVSKTDLTYELPKICNPMVSGFDNTTDNSISSVKTDDTKGPFSKTSPISSDFGTITDSNITDVKLGNKNTPIRASTNTYPAKDYTLKLEFKEDLDDNIILVVHPTIDDHLPVNSWQNNKSLY